MTGVRLPASFVEQSGPVVEDGPVVSVTPIDDGRGLAIALAVGSAVRIAGLLPRRFYRLEGGDSACVRADQRGIVRVSARDRLLAIWPVV